MAALAHNLDVRREACWSCWPDIDIYWIGDTSHAARASDHNPDGRGIVHAIDVMSGDGKASDDVVAWALAGTADLEYVIHAGHIWSRDYGWTQRTYTGSNPHTDHVHISGRHGSTGYVAATGTGYDTDAEKATPKGSPCGADTIGDDDMPDYVSASRPAMTFAADGEWRRVVFTAESADTADVFALEGAFRIGAARYVATLELASCTPDRAGVTVYTRVLELDADTEKVVKTGGGDERPMTSGGTSIRDTIAGSCNAGDKLRFEVAANGGGKLDIAGAKLRLMFWPT